MPYKNTADRSEWDRRNRLKYKKQYKARHRANEVHKLTEVCSIKDCNKKGQRHHPDYSKPEDIIWFCDFHHKQVHRKYANQCVIEGCNRKHHSKGYCKLHYNRMMRENPNYYQKELEKNREYKKRLKTKHDREV